MKLLLIGAYPGIQYSASLSALHAALTKFQELADIQIEQYLFKLPDTDFANPWLGMPSNNEAKLLDEIFNYEPNIVGFSCYPWNVHIFNRITQAIKSCRPELYVIYGGPIVANNQKVTKAVADCMVDFIVEGEGENVFPKLLISLKTGDLTAAYQIPGVHALKAGKYIYAGPPDEPVDLQNQASPILTFEARQTDWLCLETYRGCNMSCAYCNWGKADKVRFYPIERIKAELFYMLQRKVERVDFLDAIFNVKPSRVNEILRFIIDNYNGVSRFTFEVYIEGLSESTMILMGDLAELGGINLCEIGLQATDIKVSRLIQRPYNPKRFWKKYYQLHEHAPALEITLDIISGLPEDTLDGLLNSYDLALTAWPNYINLFPCAVVPGSALDDKSERFGFSLTGLAPYHVVGTPTMKADTMANFAVFERLLNFIFMDLRWSLRLAFLALRTKTPARFLWNKVQLYWQTGNVRSDKMGFVDFFFSNLMEELGIQALTAHWVDPLCDLLDYERTLLDKQKDARQNRYALRIFTPTPNHSSDLERQTISGNQYFSMAYYKHDVINLIEALKKRSEQLEAFLKPCSCILGFCQERNNESSTRVSVLRVPVEMKALLAAFDPPCNRQVAWARTQQCSMAAIGRKNFDEFVDASLACGALILI